MSRWRLAPGTGWSTWCVPGASVLATTLFVLVDDARTRELDFGTYLLGGRLALSDRLYAAVYAPTHLGFTYPPFAALVFAAGTPLPPLVGRMGFAAVSLAALWALLAVCLRAVRPAMPARAVIWWACALMLPAFFLGPVNRAFSLGQVDVLVVLLTVADVVRPSGVRIPASNARLPQGVLTGVAAAVILTPLVFVPVLFLAGRRAGAARAAGTFALVGGVSALVVPDTSWRYWTRTVFDVRRIGHEAWIGNQSLRGALLRAAHHVLSMAATDLLGVGVIAAGVVLGAWCVRHATALLGAVVVWSAESLGAPVTWTHQLVWIVGLLAWLALSPSRPRHGAWWAVAVALVGWASPNWWPSHDPSAQLHEAGWQLVAGDAFVVVGVAFLVGTAIWAWRRRVALPAAVHEPSEGAPGAPGAPRRRPVGATS